MPFVLLLLLGGGATVAIAAAKAAAARRRWEIEVGEEGAVITASSAEAASATPVQRPAYTVLPPAAAPAPKMPVGVVAEGKFTGKFGVSRSSTHRHNGIDISAKRGTPIRAINKGQVVGVYPDGVRYGYGNSVLLKHPDGKLSFYAHMHTIKVRTGQTVAQGDMIGTVGSTQKRIRNGKVQPNPRPHMPPHLHMEVQTGVTLSDKGVPIIGESVPGRIDPLQYMAQVNARPVGVEVSQNVA